jgi:hypothetical protein
VGKVAKGEFPAIIDQAAHQMRTGARRNTR